MFSWRGAYLLFLLIISIWLLLIFLAPFFASVGGIFELPSQLIYLVFSPFCHQIPERSFFLFGHQLGACARCIGIYFGIFISAILYQFVKKIDNAEFPKMYWLALAALPLAIDGGTQIIGLRESNNLLRAITGFILGFVLVFYIVPAYNRTVKSMWRRLRKTWKHTPS